jgi:Outer membrane protein beta-barrel domain
MKKIFIAAAVAASFLGSQAFAQTNNFRGFSAGLNLNLAGSVTELSDSTGKVKIGDTSQNAGLQAAYTFAPSEQFAIGIGATYSLSDLNAGSGSSGTTTYEFKAKDIYTVYVEPGFVIGNNTLGYAKLAYTGTRADTKATVSGVTTTATDNFNGSGYGAGIRTLLDKNVYLQVEFMQVTMNELTRNGVTLKPTSTLGTIGLGYKF